MGGKGDLGAGWRSYFSTCRTARGLLKWTVRDLAEHSGVHRKTITKIEADQTKHEPTIAAVVRTLEAAGVEFINGDGPA